MSELKKCPFCGGEVVMFIEQLDATRDCYNFHCDNCDMSIYYDYSDRNMAIKTWNKRKPVERVIERLEEYANDLKEDWDKYDNEDDFGGYCAVSRAIEIIKEELM